MRSPCIGVCVYDHHLNHCKGCYRSLEEIDSWAKMTDTEKRKALKRCKERARKSRGENVHPANK